MPPRPASNPSPGFTLALGAGGRVGMASHAGVLRALDEIGGLPPASAGLVIGTSAGSVIGTLVRLGWSTTDIWGVATRTVELDEPGDDIGGADLFHRSWGTPAQLARRSLGSAYVMSQSLIRIPTVPIPRIARRIFPGGFMSVSEEAGDVGTGIPDEWPGDPLWLCTVDIETGRRVVLGRRGDEPPLSQAVLASCAIPGYYEPVRLDGRTLVDGGVHSSTNLDLAAKAPPQLVIAIAPMGHDPRRAPGPIARAVRRPINRGLARQRMTLSSLGHEVLLIRPGRDELVAHGLNPMRLSHLEPVAVAAYDAAARLLGRPDVRRRITAAMDHATPVADAS